jgi:hypothetical protein
VAKSSWTKPGSRGFSSLPPLRYDDGPFPVVVRDYTFRMWGIRSNDDHVQIEEFTQVTWDDSSAVLTGSITFQTPEWAGNLKLRGGNEVLCEVSDNDGKNFTPLWRMRLVQPNSDLAQRSRSATLVNDLQLLNDSDDDFAYTADRSHPGGWRIDQIIRDICDRYGIEIGTLPVMKARVKKWHLTDQRPLDVIHSALLREKNVTGKKYSVSLDVSKRLHVTSFKRPRHLYELGSQLIAATYSEQFDPRFATALTVRADLPDTAKKDKKGHRTVRHNKISVSVQSDNGVKVFGFIHRNVYSPDANSEADLTKEGGLFLHAVAKPIRQFTVNSPGLPFVRRLDAFRFLLPERGLSQTVYVTDARHTVAGSGGYTVEIVVGFDDPFVDQAAQTILNKLSDVAVARKRKSPAKTTPKPKAGNSQVRSTKTTAPPPSLYGNSTAGKKSVTRK